MNILGECNIAHAFVDGQVFKLAGVGSEVAKANWTLLFLLVVAVLAIVRHHSNIRRLLDGTESRFGKDKKNDSSEKK